MDSYAKVAEKSHENISVKPKIDVGTLNYSSILSTTKHSMCKKCKNKPLPEEELCFHCYHNKDEKNSECKSKCPMEGCDNYRMFKTKTEFYDKCFKCISKCNTEGCDNPRKSVEGKEKKYHKKCVECFSKCLTDGCVNVRSKASNGFLYMICSYCYNKNKSMIPDKI